MRNRPASIRSCGNGLRRGVLPPVEDLAGDPPDVPVVGHLGEQHGVEVVASWPKCARNWSASVSLVEAPIGDLLLAASSGGVSAWPPLPGLVRVGSALGVGSGWRSWLGAAHGGATAVARRRSGDGVGLGTTRTTGRRRARGHRGGRGADGRRSLARGRGRRAPASGAAPGAVLPDRPGDARRAHDGHRPDDDDMAVAARALCRPIGAVFHRTARPAARGSMGPVSEQQKQADNRGRATTDEFRAFVEEGWAPRRGRGHRPGPGRGARRRPAGGAQRGLPQAAARRPRRRPQGAQQRHRLRLPPAHRVRVADRPRGRPRAGCRARPRAGHRRRRRGIRPRGGALLPPARRPRQRRVLRRRPLRRVLGRRPPDPRRRRARARRHRPAHRRVRGRRRQGCR